MDMSLDDIIRTKKITPNFPKKLPFKSAPYKAGKVFTKDTRIRDARLKIIERNRAKIRDARDKLTEITRSAGDARLRLVRKQGITSASHRNRKAALPRIRNHKPEFALNDRKRLPEVIGIPRGYVDYDNMERMEEEEYAASLNRVVPNELAYENFLTDRHPKDPWEANGGGDPFDLYNIPISRAVPDINPDEGLRRQIRQVSVPRTVRQLSPPYSRRYIPQPASHLSYEMRSRLQHAPDRNVSMGIFSNPLKPQNSSSQFPGYRIVVSNLNTSVTEGDIKELFEDLGELYDSRLVRPGIAEVIYKNLKDAEKAVETYHNRQLDGQPMKCLLVNPRSSSKPTAPAIKIINSNSNRVPSGKPPVEIDIDALHKVLFRRH